MRDGKIDYAIRMAYEFITRAEAAKKTDVGPRETGALRRQSMELTRALADLRRAN